MTTKERMVPSVEMARGMYRFWSDVMCAGPCSDFCADTHAMAEAAGLALDMATAAAHPAVREPSWRTVVEEVA